MVDQILSSINILKNYRSAPGAQINRSEVHAHALLSSYVHHWPSRSTPEIEVLLAQTPEIRRAEPSRWMTQRRLAVAILSRELLHLDENTG